MDTNAEKAAALLLQWVEEGKTGMPNEETLADAVTFAQLAQKDRLITDHLREEGVLS